MTYITGGKDLLTLEKMHNGNCFQRFLKKVFKNYNGNFFPRFLKNTMEISFQDFSRIQLKFISKVLKRF